MKPPYKAQDICYWFIWRSKLCEITWGLEPLSLLKLMGFLYYSQCYYLSIYKIPLFDEPIESWKYGPVIRSVWEYYHNQGNVLLNLEANYLSCSEIISQPDQFFLELIFQKYNPNSAIELSKKTRKTKAWENAYNESSGHTKIDLQSLCNVAQNAFRHELILRIDNNNIRRKKNHDGLQVISTFEDGWDGEYAQPIPVNIISFTDKYIDKLIYQPHVVPTRLQTVAIEYRPDQESYLSINISSTEQITIFEKLNGIPTEYIDIFSISNINQEVFKAHENFF